MPKTPNKSWLGLVALAISVSVAFTGCGGAGGEGGGLTGDLGVVSGTYLVVTLSNGEWESKSEIPDLATNDDYRTTKMVFKLIDTSTPKIGSVPSEFGSQSDEDAGHPEVLKFSMGVFEVTQKQWDLMGGHKPWNGAGISAIVGGSAVSPDKPAFSLSFDEVDETLSHYNRGKTFVFELPTDEQWECACRGGGTGLYCWGNSRSETIIDDYAITWETSSGIRGPRVVGQRQPNAYGMYDMHGNVWEHTAEMNIRGGSWFDSISQARSANKLSPGLDKATDHCLVGARLVMRVP